MEGGSLPDLEQLRKEELADTKSRLKSLKDEQESLTVQVDLAQLKNKRLKEQLAGYDVEAKNTLLHLESIRVYKMPWYWVLLVIGTITSTFLSFASGALVFAFANFIAFLFVWRGLYVPGKSNRTHMVAAAIVVGMTYWFG